MIDPAPCALASQQTSLVTFLVAKTLRRFKEAALFFQNWISKLQCTVAGPGVGPKSLVLFDGDTGPWVNYHTQKYIYEPWCSGEWLPERRLKPAGGSFGGDVPPLRLRLTSNYKRAVRKPQITSRGFIGSKAQLNGLFQVQ